MNYELMLIDDKTVYYPVVTGDITINFERKGAPGSMDFKVLNDNNLKIRNGQAVRFSLNSKNVFYGFIFSIDYDHKDEISVKCFDQLRYLKNKDTYIYENKSASEVITMIANDFNMQLGVLEDTLYKIPSRVEDNQTLFDIIQNALDLTLDNTGKIYCMYDDFGHITLKSIENMAVNILIDKETACEYSYKSSIDEDTYNQIKLIKTSQDKSVREVYMAKDSSNINKWGVLQLYETLHDGEDGQAKADLLLKMKNKEKRTLSINNCLGNLNVRAGCLVGVMLELKDIKIKNYMLVEKCKHNFKGNLHTMDLEVRGGLFA